MNNISLLLPNQGALNCLREMAREVGMNPLAMARIELCHARSGKATMAIQVIHYARELGVPHEEVLRMASGPRPVW